MPIPGANAESFTIDPVSNSDAGVYDVEVSSPCGPQISDPANLTVVDSVTVVTQPRDQTICVGSPLTLSVTAAGGGTLRYQWRKEGVNLPGETQPTLHYALAQQSDAGNYDVFVSNECSTVASNIAAVIVSVGVTITRHPKDQQVCEGGSVTFVVEA